MFGDIIDTSVVEVCVPWRSSAVWEQRLEFVRLVEAGGVSFAVLCRRFGISRPTGYKWVARYWSEGVAGLVNRSTVPKVSPLRTPEAVEELVCAAREAHPGWGGRKLRGFLLRQGHSGVPAASTITQILRRHGLMEHEVAPRRDYLRFERAAPNELWQMDFKGHFGLEDGTRCHPFGVIDDYSRYSISLVACGDERTGTVKQHLQVAFGRYGLPEAMLCDNGSPWGNNRGQSWTPLTVWLADLGVEVIHTAPFHPQTNGKKERLHLTLDIEVLNTRPVWRDLGQVQEAFEAWEPVYNHHRPHQSLGETVVPADRYRPSPRSLPDQVAPHRYPDHWHTRKVDTSARISFLGRRVRTGRAFKGRHVAVAPTTDPDVFHIYYRHHHIRTINL
ncbi:MAG: IS481 family transposase [Acidimicrobiia bacterium]|nr:IS481 family transposase [Acidimicrobiia bacterium]